jgi:isoleucyl-tRNA synthetase
MSPLIREELNVKEVNVTEKRDILQSHIVKPVPKILGKKHGKNFTAVAQAIKVMTSEQTETIARGNPITLMVGNERVNILPEEVELESIPIEGYSIMEENGLLIGIKTAIDEALSSEGLARDVVRRIQSLRKEANFDITDHIETYYSGDPEIIEVFQEEGAYIKAETLSDLLHEGVPPEDAKTCEYEIGDLQLLLGLRRK